MENSSPSGQRNSQLHTEIGVLLDELNGLFSDSLHQSEQISKSRKVFSGLKNKINEFETNPKQLDLHLQKYTDILTLLFRVVTRSEDLTIAGELRRGVSETLYIFAKVRGFKHISNYFSSDVYIIDWLIGLIELDNLDDSSVFVCLLWLSNLVLVPFPLDQVNEKLSTRIYQTALKHLGLHKSASKNQAVSLILLSRLLTRKDSIENGILEEYFSSLNLLWNHENAIDLLASVKLGHLMTINKILKKVSNDVVAKYVDFVYNEIVHVDIVTLRYQSQYAAAQASASVLTNLNVLHMIKILTKLSKFYMQSHNYTHVAAIVNNLLNDIMGPFLDLFDSSLRYGMAKNLANLVKSLGLYALNYKEQVILYILELLNIKNLAAPVLEYTGHKGKDVFSSDLDIGANDISITRHHTVLLFVAFTALNRSLPTCFIPAVFSIVHKTLFTTQKRMNSNFGNQIRDSSCFIVWAVSRSLDETSFRALNNGLKIMMNTILVDMMKVVIFDDDLTLRKCGIAVIQEFIGRFGRFIFEPCLHDSSLTHIQNSEALGSFLIRFVEIFDSSATALLQSSYLLIPKLVGLGFKSDLLLPTLMQNLLNEDVLFRTKTLNSKYLEKLLREPATIQPLRFDVGSAETGQAEVLTLFQQLSGAYDHGNHSSLYAMADILPLIEPSTLVIPRIQVIVETFTFDHHIDDSEKGESFLRFINACLESTEQFFNFNSVWDMIFAISRLSSDTELSQEFQKLFKNLHLWHVAVPDDHFSGILHYVRNGNMNLAKSLSFLDLNKARFESILTVLEDSSIDSDIRSQIIKSFNSNLPNHTFVEEKHLLRLLNLLDDYTTTIQGDVGSKVRYAILKLVSANTNLFSNDGLRLILERKSIRMAGETIDKIKFEAFKLLSVVNHEDLRILQFENDETYYQELFRYHATILNSVVAEPDNLRYKTLIESFWRGIIFSLGSTAATHSIIVESFHCLLRFIQNASEEEVVLVFDQLLCLLAPPDGVAISKVDLRTSKRFILALNLFIRLFEAEARFPHSFDYGALVRGSYNHISAPAKLGLVLKIFLHVAISPKAAELLRHQCIRLVVTLSCTNKLAKTRNMASEILFEIVNELQPANIAAVRLLDNIDWDDSPSSLKVYQDDLTRVFQKI